MVAVSRMSILVLALLLLGVLVWHDSQQDEPGQSARVDATGTPPKMGSSVEEENGKPHTKKMEQAAKWVARPAEASPNPLVVLQQLQFRETLNRPLFAPRRRRPPPKKVVRLPPPPKPPPPKPKLPSYELLGIMKNGSRALAILREKQTQNTFRVEIGDSIGGWEVSDITSKRIVLRGSAGDGQKVTLFEQQE